MSVLVRAAIIPAVRIKSVSAFALGQDSMVAYDCVWRVFVHLSTLVMSSENWTGSFRPGGAIAVRLFHIAKTVSPYELHDSRTTQPSM